MRTIVTVSLGVLLAVLLTLPVSVNAQQNESSIDQKVNNLLNKMTLQEKVGQMMQITIDQFVENSDGPPFHMDKAKLRKGIVDYHLGSILNVPSSTPLTRQNWHEVISDIQDVAMKETRLGIPVIYGIDAIHGENYTAGATLFPQEIGLAATFNRDLVENLAEISAYETKASSIPWNFSPVLGLGRDPRWPRFWETFGEDPYLASQMSHQMIKGYEGDDISDPYHVAACAKHYLGYSVPNSGQDRTPAWIPERQLRELFLPSFKAAFEEGVHTVMVNSGEINGVPVHASHRILTDLLKDEIGFKGFVVSDWQDIMYLHDRYHLAKTQKEAVKIAINAGIDMSMVPNSFKFADYLVELAQDGEVPMSRINDAVRRILKVKYELGLFEQPVPDFDQYPKFGSDEFVQKAYQAAEESITLLKNSNDVLPLDKEVNVLVTGPNANSMRTLNGGWSYSWQGDLSDKYAADKQTILEAIQQKLGANHVQYVDGVRYKEDAPYYADEIHNLDKAVKAAKNVDYIILAAGENSYTETPGDLTDMTISSNQIQLAKALAKTGKPVILVLNEGRPRIISDFEGDMDAVLQSYLPSNEGGRALADILFGDVNPSGKLPYTYPRYPNKLINYNHKYTEELPFQENPNGSDFWPQYEFGDGLSYTTFSYSDLRLSKQKISSREPVDVSVTVKNTGERAGKESVLLFLSDEYASITPPVKELKGFQKVNLKPGKSQTVHFQLKPEDLSFIGLDNKPVIEAGTFKVTVKDLQQAFEVTDTREINR